MPETTTSPTRPECGECGAPDVPLYLAVWGDPATGESGETYLCGPCGEHPESRESCAGCERPLLFRRPDRTHCEACRPTIRGTADILAGRPSTIHDDGHGS